MSMFPSRRPNGTTQHYREWQGQRISGFSDHMEDPTFHKSTAGLTGDNSPFSESEDFRTSRFNHIIIPKPNMAYARYPGQVSLNRDTPYWDAQRSLSRQDEDGFTASSSFVNQDLNKLNGVSYKPELLVNNSYKHSRNLRDSEPSSSRKMYKRSADAVERDGENATSAFKVFKRNDNKRQFSRINERNKNLPPPPPLVKANERMKMNSKLETKSRENIIVIGDSPPPQARSEKCHSKSRKDPFKLETISRETLHHSKPISSTRVHTMEYQQPIGPPKTYSPRDEREALELTQRCHCHHYDNMPYVSKGLPRFSNVRNDRVCSAKTMPFVTTQNATRSHYEPHTGIQCYSDHHSSVTYSPTRKTSGLHKNNHSRSHMSPSRNASSPTFCDSHEALHAWRVKSQLTESPSDSQINNAFVADVLRNDSKDVSSNLLDSRSPFKQDSSAVREQRQSKDHRLQTTVVKDKVVRSQMNGTENLAIQNNLEYPCQRREELAFRFLNQKMPQLSKTDQAKLSKLFEIHCQAKNSRHQFIIAQQPSRASEIYDYHEVEKLAVSQSPNVQSSSSVTQKSKHEQKQETLRSLLLSPNSQGKGCPVLTNTTRDKVVMRSGLTDSALISPRKGHQLSHLPVYSSPAKGCCLSLSGNMTTRGKPGVMSQATFSSSLPNGDRLYGKASQDKKILEMTSKSNASRSPPNLASYKKSLKETKNQKGISSQPIGSTDTEKAPLVQKNRIAMFQSPPQSRRLSYPLENSRLNENRSPENSSVRLQRTKSEGDHKNHCGTDVSSLLDNFREDETTQQPCGGYAFDHDSMPIIVAVHSIVVKDDNQEGIEIGREEKTKGAILKKSSAITSSHCVVDPISTSKNEPTRYQRLLPKPDTKSEKTNLSEKMHVSGDQLVREQMASLSSSSSTSLTSSSSSSSSSLSTSQLSSSSVLPLSSLPSASSSSSTTIASSPSSSSATAAEIGQPVNKVSTTSSIPSHRDDYKQVSQASDRVRKDISSNDLNVKHKGDKAVLADDTSNTINVDSTTSVPSEISTNGSSSLPNKSAEEVENKGKSSKSIMNKCLSVQELSKKIMETRERIVKENIDWKKKLLRRLEFVLIKKLKRAERETGNKASIDLLPEKKVKGKEEKKKAKNCKRNKSCSDETSPNVEQEGKDAKEKSQGTTQKSSDKINEANNANKEKKIFHPKYDITELDESKVDEESKSKTISRKESVDSVIMSQDEIHADVNEENFPNKNEMLVAATVNDGTTDEQCNGGFLPSLSPAREDEGFADYSSCSDLVIAE
uniref:Uncharacterized protein LOC116303112 isoform X2 n=1 Tax=Actinia tenebrosa TaxID=6105 RepID=A0A6P8IQ67_ACTTE